MADVRALIRGQSGYAGWDYGQTVDPSAVNAALTGQTVVDVAGLVHVTGDLMLSNGNLHLRGTSPSAEIRCSAGYTGYAFSPADGMTIETLKIIAQIGTGNSINSYFGGEFNDVTFLDCDLGKVACYGRNNVFSGGTITSGITAAVSFPFKSTVGNTFTGVRFVKIGEEGWGCDYTGSIKPATLQVTGVDGNDITFSVHQDIGGILSSSVVGHYVCLLQPSKMGQYFEVANRSGNTLTLTPDRFTLDGLTVGSYFTLAPAFVENTLENCTMGVVNWSWAASGYYFPSCAVSLFGGAFGNTVRNVTIVSDNAAAGEDPSSSGHSHLHTVGIRDIAYCNLEGDGTTEIIRMNAFNTFDGCDLTAADEPIFAGTVFNTTWDTLGYDSLADPDGIDPVPVRATGSQYIDNDYTAGSYDHDYFPAFKRARAWAVDDLLWQGNTEAAPSTTLDPFITWVSSEGAQLPLFGGWVANAETGTTFFDPRDFFSLDFNLLSVPEALAGEGAINLSGAGALGEISGADFFSLTFDLYSLVERRRQRVANLGGF